MWNVCGPAQPYLGLIRRNEIKAKRIQTTKMNQIMRHVQPNDETCIYLHTTQRWDINQPTTKPSNIIRNIGILEQKQIEMRKYHLEKE